VRAAADVLEETGNEDAITLRGVARQVGIAAPSIYRHFKDVDAIVLAVVADAFAELDAALETAAGSAASVDRLRAVCVAYLDFARDRPHRYRVMFGRHRETRRSAAITEPRPADGLLGAAAFDTLATAVAAHLDSEPDRKASAEATTLWVALHGYASLHDAVPAFPWPEPADMLDTLLERLVRSTDGTGRRGGDLLGEPCGVVLDEAEQR